MDSLQTSINIAETNKGNLEKWTSDSDYQTFLTLDDKTQQTNISLVQDIIKVAIGAVKDSLQNVINYMKEFAKMGEDMLEEMEKSFGSTPQVIQGKKEMQKQKDIIAKAESKLSLSQQDISEQIITIRQVWNEIEKLD